MNASFDTETEIDAETEMKMEFELYAWLRLYADEGVDPEQLVKMLLTSAVVVDELNAVPRTPPGRDTELYKQMLARTEWTKRQL